jgi:hypothetical protein
VRLAEEEGAGGGGIEEEEGDEEGGGVEEEEGGAEEDDDDEGAGEAGEGVGGEAGAAAAVAAPLAAPPAASIYEVQVLGGQIGRADWSGLCGLAQEEISRIKELAAREGTAAHATRGVASVSAGLEEAAAKATALGDALQAAAAGVTMFKRLAAEVDQQLVANDEKKNKVSGLLKKQLDKIGVSVQRYWAATLVGPDCRRFLQNHKKILLGIAADMEAAGHSPSECTDFVDKHSAVLAPLDTVLHLTRKTEMLDKETEMPVLRAACTQFGAAWRASYSDRDGMLTVKGHIVEAHVADFVEHYGTAGVFGEDGAEAIHVSDAACRRIVRQMRNPIDRHRAAMLHHIAYQFTPTLQRDIKKRKRGNGSGAVADAVDEIDAAAGAAVTATELMAMPVLPALMEGADGAIADLWNPA